MAKILVVDDEVNIVDILCENLVREGYQVCVAYDGEQAVALATSEKPDLILLDCMLPKLNGLEVCRQIRHTLTMPIVMLTAKGDEVDKVVGLELGADDYITKPFSPREVLARVKAQLRRNQLAAEPQTDDSKQASGLVFGDLCIDEASSRVLVKGVDVELTPLEYNLVCCLARNAGQVLRREELLTRVWGYDYFGDVRNVDVTVLRTREKIEIDLSNPKYIMTKRGFGYYFNKHPEQSND